MSIKLETFKNPTAIKIGGDNISVKKGYKDALMSIDRANLLVYFPCQETSGTTLNEMVGSHNGTYVNTVVGNDVFTPKGGVAPLLDGDGDYASLYTSYLNSNFLGTKGTLSCWARVLSNASTFIGDGAEVTVTKTAHGLSVSDVIRVFNTDNSSVLADGTHTVVSTPTVDTFTIAGTNTGSGTMDYAITFDNGVADRFVRIAGSGSNDVNIGINSSGSFRASYSAGGVSGGSSAASINIEWNHFVITWKDFDNGNVCEFFVNGVSEGTFSLGAGGSWTGALDSNLTNIGVSNAGSNLFPFDGNVCHVAVWNSVLTDSQVLALYQRG